MWMLLERVRFTLDGLECNKIGVSYEAFNGQPDFCSSPLWSCLHNQLWNFHEADQNRIRRNQLPLYGVLGRFERINEHPGAGSHSFSIGITESLNTNLLIEIVADDIEYVNQRSPGKILGVTVPTFEALAQFGVAKITTKNIGKVEASYSLTFDCSRGVTMMEEQFFIMKPDEVVIRSFKIDPTTDQAAKYSCSAILKDSEFNEVDRAECQFTTTATVLDNGTQGVPFQPPKSNMKGVFESIKDIWNKFWAGFSDFITGKSCRSKCSGFFDFHCHMQYICISWVVMFGLFLSIFPTVLVLVWLLHQKGLFDPLYDWWEDHCWHSKPRHKHNIRRHRIDMDHPRNHPRKHKAHHHNRHDAHHYKHRTHGDHGRDHALRINDHNQYLHKVHRDKDKRKHKHGHHPSAGHVIHLEAQEDDGIQHHRLRKEKRALNRTTKMWRRHSTEDVPELCDDYPF